MSGYPIQESKYRKHGMPKHSLIDGLPYSYVNENGARVTVWQPKYRSPERALLEILVERDPPKNRWERFKAWCKRLVCGQ